MLLLEIGTEEIPARFLPPAMVKLQANAEKMFTDNRVTFKAIKAFATPRRLCLIVEGLSSQQEAAEREMWGPPVSAAFDANGNPTRAAEAFAGVHGITVDALLRKEKAKGAYVVALIRESAQPTENILPEILSQLVLSLSFPKSMRWGSGTLRFARPIHWILAMYANKKIVFEIEGIKSSNMTRGHRFLSPAAFEIKDSKSYVHLLKNNFVILDPEERKKIIIEEAAYLTSSVKAALVADEELIDHVAFLVEYPKPVLGAFPADYLSLPPELLITVMKGHQKYFAVRDSMNKLTEHFIIVSNTREENALTIRKGAEKVIKARFEDARFYYEEDKKTSLKERHKDLKKVAYHEKLGNLYDKSLRISAIADFIADKCFPDKSENVCTAATLAKADLISGVVREFPELQGIMGGYYAQHEGHNKEISEAISEHYLPAHSGDRLPRTDIGAAVSLADKVDNIVSFFNIGLAPTATEDPFALRRQTIGVISILIGKRYDLTIHGLFEKALNIIDSGDIQNVLEGIDRFFGQRFDNLMQTQGYPQDSVSAVTGFVKDRPLHTVKERLDALQKFKADASYETFLLSIKRINNIAPKHETPPVDKKLFAHEEESALFNETESITPDLHGLLGDGKYYDAINLLLTLKGPINSFFDKVLVMDKNEEVKNNRLSLIKNIRTLASLIADFSKLS